MPESIDANNLSPGAQYRRRNAVSDAGSVCSNVAPREEEIPVSLTAYKSGNSLHLYDENYNSELVYSCPPEQNKTLPQVMVTPSQAHSTRAVDLATPVDKRYPQCASSSVPFPSKNTTEPHSTSSSVPSERDKLAELPASNAFMGQRIFSVTRKINTDTSSLNTHESCTSSLNPPKFRAIESENSFHANKSREPLPKRTSFDNDRLSISSSIHHVKSGFIGTSHSLPIVRGEETSGNARIKSVPRARSPSPLHFPFHKFHQKDEPFLPIDPYRFHVCKAPKNFFSQLLCQSYRHLLLCLPSIYFSRVSRVFTAAELSRPEVERMIDGRNHLDKFHWPANHEWVDSIVSPAMIRFKESWENFIESVLKEWKTLNVVSALLLTAVLAILQIEGASRSLVIRSSASLSLICGLMSLIYGCVYILRFATMKSMYRAFIWAEEAQQVSSILWNIWVLLSLPAVWIAWSMLFFCISILAFVWEEPGSLSDNDILLEGGTLKHKASHFSSTTAVMAPKILISLVFALGLLYFTLVIRTFRSWRDTDVSQAARDSMEIGRWTTKSPSPGREVASAVKQTREGNTVEKSHSHQADSLEGKVNQTNKGLEQKKSRRTRSVGSSDLFQ